ncbi:uncharacterized protein KGF55_000639 [Candida pseudojiufengensis]|uniref:uncharacterized protein n=1 Tax=Candida pseudojiufengensis TaxID=497109 RepID=UPI0022259DE6|nr:uncharacterized protein KGF55_000639 [Candida pseudojiufengensis]KAI5966330.1 hypothetical protein KGF55_000639 [Candida pseudojiufengensis]
MSPNRSKFFNPETAPYYDPKEDRRVVLITGGNTGIGWYTVLHLYLHGYIIYMAGRTESKVLKAFEDIKKEAELRNSKLDKIHPVGELHYIHIDLLDLSSIPQAVKAFSEKESKLDILIGNAGIMGVPYKVTKDDYEIQYQVNFVAHFLLILELLPYLKKESKSGITPRIVLLSSIGHNFASYKHFKPEQNKLNCFPNSIYTWVRYGIAKTSEIQLVKQLAVKEPEILSIAVHPGIILGTELYNHWRELPIVKYAANAVFAISDKVMGVSNEEGALATLKACMSPELNLKKDNGEYFVTGGVVEKPSKNASNLKYGEETWDWNVKELQKRGFNV